MKIFYALIFFMMLSNIIECRDYCQVCRNHTMCKYTQINSLKKCGTIIKRGVNNNNKETILKVHNNLRSRLAKGQETRGVGGGQPSAANMRKMRWNDELATIAQRWSDQCVFQHDDCRNTDRYNGQNIYLSISTFDLQLNPDFERAANLWWDEVKIFPSRNINPFRYVKNAGHYTQMAWADSYEIGCGFTYYKINGEYNSLITCDYGPGGNVLSEMMYKVGNACSSCPSGTKCNQSTKLCE